MQRELLREDTFTPYREGCGPGFTLRTYSTNRNDRRGCEYIAYTLTSSEAPESPIFEGADFNAGPCHCIDSDEAINSLMGFLTLRRGDTDADYFENYTAAQLEFSEQHAETLGYEAMCQLEPQETAPEDARG